MDIKHFTGIKLYHGEHILDIQRQHWIVVVMPILTYLVVASSVLLVFFILSNQLVLVQYQLQDLMNYVLIAVLSFIISLITYTYLYWYFQVYLISNKRIAHVHFFRIGGFHFDEVFHTQTTPLEIDRNQGNFILDFFGIEDLFVHFPKIERPEPFIFRLPQRPDVIEELLEGHTMQKNGR